MTAPALIRAWVTLVGLTGLSTALHLSGIDRQITGPLIVIFAGVKARLVLLDYLELRGVEGWSTGILSGLYALVALFLILLWVA